MHRSVFGSLCVIGCVVVGSLGAQSAGPTCEGPEYRQFDFWVGDWVVTSGGQPAGTNHVTREERGCLIHEHWTGAGGGSGQSLNFYDRADGRWHQVWVDAGGNVLTLSGRTWTTVFDGLYTKKS